MASLLAQTSSLSCSFLNPRTPETEVSPSADGMEAVLDVAYADYAAWADRFMSPDAQELFPVRFSEAEGGGLIVRKAETDNRSDWLNAELRSVSAGITFSMI